MDPSGNEPIDAALDDAMRTGTLVEFPPGEYLVTRKHSTQHVSRFGIRGLGDSRRDVQFVPPARKGVQMLSGGGPGPLLLENFSLNERMGGDAGLSLGLGTDVGLYMGNIEFLGQTPEDSVLPGTYQLSVPVFHRDGVAVLENVVAGVDAPAVKADYPAGTEFLYAGPSHRGEIVMRNCRVHERNSNGTRVTNGSGVLTIEGGEFVNNQNANIRLSPGNHPSKVSSVTGTSIRVDGSRRSSDGIRLDSGSSTRSGTVFEDMTIEWSRDRGRGVIAAPGWANHGGATFRNCVVRNDGANTATLRAEDVGGGSETAIVMENCAFTGSGKGFIAQNRRGSIVRDSCVDMPNAGYSGVETRNLAHDHCRIPGDGSGDSGRNEGPTAEIAVTDESGLTVSLSGENSSDPDGSLASYTWDVNGTSYDGATVSHTFDEAGTYAASLTVEDDGGATATASTELTVHGGNELKIQGTGVPTNYEFTVDGSLHPVGETIERWDDVSETGATGWVTDVEDIDRFRFEGELAELQFLEGEAYVFVNGEKVDAKRFTLPNTIVIDGRNAEGESSYEFEVTGDIVADPLVGGIESHDSITDGRVSGLVKDSVDAYRFSGNLNSFSIDGNASVSFRDNDG